MNSFTLADMTVHRVEEFTDPACDAMAFFPDLTVDLVQKHADWLVPQFYDAGNNTIRLVMQTWVVRTKHHTILIDTCNGNHKPRPYFPLADQLNTPYLEHLTAAGAAPEDVDFVMCTHMHIDHVGWNTRLDNGRWVPTFPNAKYLFSQIEHDQFLPENYVDGKVPMFADVFADSVLPVIEAGQAHMVSGRYELNDTITIDPAPGHTSGHYIVRAGTPGQMGLFVGDAIHNPIQIAEPQISTAYCSDKALAAKSRLAILEDCAEHGHLLVPTHFDPPYIGHVQRKGTGFHFVPGR